MGRQDAAAPPIAFRPHDHGRCSDEAVAAAEAVCAARGARMTPVRRRVLEMLWESHQPLGAYELLDRLKDEGFGSTPPVIYRVLDFLIAHGFAHKLQRHNTYVGCPTPGATHNGQFLVCRGCGKVAEIADTRVARALRRAAAEQGFSVGDAVLEIEGLCHVCAGLGQAGPA